MTTLDPSDGLALITDGSADYRDRSGGWAWVAVDAFDGMQKASGYRADTTNNQMELMAATEGLVTLAAACGPCEVLVYSDSEYVVLGARVPTRSRKKNTTFWQDLDRAIGLHKYVEWNHVKGHSGHLFNEMVDQMASAARRKGTQ